MRQAAGICPPSHVGWLIHFGGTSASPAALRDHLVEVGPIADPQVVPPAVPRQKGIIQQQSCLQEKQHAGQEHTQNHPAVRPLLQEYQSKKSSTVTKWAHLRSHFALPPELHDLRRRGTEGRSM
eukprot:CAMPEP_0175706868 /NCGR_PEP_ID=MMETSP0097-20121207/38267_1 /TAXON_ID=311494 /ORGANISM="Alexandrium monilatum, Strain CCMP3105" /LENGTH=123 /DNA_ID=CAMNT_0017014227 /DNA_START=37 /DNA_END=409 /DNA_ORIENTATION=-